jgi:hypothetical protein
MATLLAYFQNIFSSHTPNLTNVNATSSQQPLAGT